jgi:hypothetical protein
MHCQSRAAGLTYRRCVTEFLVGNLFHRASGKFIFGFIRSPISPSASSRVGTLLAVFRNGGGRLLFQGGPVLLQGVVSSHLGRNRQAASMAVLRWERPDAGMWTREDGKMFQRRLPGPANYGCVSAHTDQVSPKSLFSPVPLPMQEVETADGRTTSRAEKERQQTQQKHTRRCNTRHSRLYRQALPEPSEI